MPRLTRWTFDLARNSDDYKVERLNDMACEFPRLDERRTGLSYRYGYFACDTNPQFKVGGFNGIGRIDHRTGKIDVYDVGAGCATNEPIFVPRADDAREGDGYLLANVYSDAARRVTSWCSMRRTSRRARWRPPISIIVCRSAFTATGRRPDDQRTSVARVSSR